MGGYTLRSDPVTRCPAARAMAAIPPMKVPLMPRIWTCMTLLIQVPGAAGMGNRASSSSSCAKICRMTNPTLARLDHSSAAFTT